MRIIIDRDIELKPLEIFDAQDIFNIIDNERDYLGEWLPFVQTTKEPADTLKYVTAVVNAPEECFEWIFAIRKMNRFIGLIGFKDTDRQNKRTEIGYWLSEKYQKQGIMTKCVERLCTFAFEDLGMNRIEIKCAVNNFPSRRIPERLGFRLEGIERDGELLANNIFTDIAVYSKLKKR